MGAGPGRGIAIVAAGLAALIVVATAPAAGPTLPGAKPILIRPPFTIGTGALPDIAVDEEGAAHVVWKEIAKVGSGNADVLHYCKVPRGQKRCTVDKVFIPPEKDAQFNTDTSHPRVVLPSPDEVEILTFRYPNGVSVDQSGNPNTCDGTFNDPNGVCYTSSSKTWAYRSLDGGATWSGPRVIDHVAPGGDAGVLQSANGGTPLVTSVTDTTTGGTFFTAAPSDGYQRKDVNLGDLGRDEAYCGTYAAMDDVKPVVAFADLGPNVFVRAHLDPNAPLFDSSAWAASKAIPGDEPRLAGGPGGVFLLYQPRSGTTRLPYAIRRIGSNGVIGPRITVGDAGSTAYRDAFEDDSGRLHVAWVQRADDGDHLRYRFSTDGANFTATGTLTSVKSRTMFNVGLGAAEDGGGFAVYNDSFLDNGTIRLVPFGATEKRTLIDVSIAGMDVTQGIQQRAFPTRDPDPAKAATFPYTGVKLAALHTTVVRVYANSKRPLAGGTVPAMALYGFRDGKQLGGGNGALLPDAVPTAIPVGPAGAISDAATLSTTTVYTFTLPWQWGEGRVELVAEINPTGLLPTVAECRRCRADNSFRITDLVFNPTARVRFDPAAIVVNGKKPKGYPDAQALFRPARETNPLPFDLPDYRGQLDLSDIANATTVDVESCFLGVWPCSTDTRAITSGDRNSLAFSRLSDWASTGSSSVYPIGVMTSGTNLGVGVTRGGSQLFGGKQPLSLVADNRPLTSIAHEYGHGLGRVHADTAPHADGSADCGGNSNGQVGEAWPPDNKGALDGIGLDITKPSPYAVLDPAVAGAPAVYYDLMSYCANINESTSGGNIPDAWMSIRNWERDLVVGAPASRRTLQASRPALPRRVAPARPAAAPTLRVMAVVPADGSKPIIAGVAPDDGAPTPVDPGGRFTLVARDGTGKALATSGAVAEVEHIEHGLPVTMVSGRVPAAGAVSVDVVEDGNAVAQRVASKHAPTLKITAPGRGARIGRGGAAKLRWKAADADGDKLTAIVEYSLNDGHTFRTISIGPNRNGVALPSTLLSASRRARIRVRIQDGFHETAATSQRFVSLGAPPSVRITAPAPGTTIVAGAALAARGEAFDDAARAVTGRALEWRVGKRVVARGGLVDIVGLGAGTHKLVLRARDHRGRRGTASLTIKVTPSKPLFTVLRGPKSVSRKARKVVLRVAASFDSRLTVGRTRTTVGHAVKRVKVRIKPGRSLLVLNLKLSSGRLSSTQQLTIPRR